MSSIHHIDDIMFENRADAQEALDNILDIYNKYGYITVADVKEIAGLNPAYTDNKYGWNSDIHKACVCRTRNGYLVHMPKVEYIDTRCPTATVSYVSYKKRDLNDNPIELYIDMNEVDDAEKAIQFVIDMAQKEPTRKMRIYIR